jgi:hypothetical protein
VHIVFENVIELYGQLILIKRQKSLERETKISKGYVMTSILNQPKNEWTNGA